MGGGSVAGAPGAIGTSAQMPGNRFEPPPQPVPSRDAWQQQAQARSDQLMAEQNIPANNPAPGYSQGAQQVGAGIQQVGQQIQSQPETLMRYAQSIGAPPRVGMANVGPHGYSASGPGRGFEWQQQWPTSNNVASSGGK